MVKSEEEILADIDTTLDQLIQNADAVQQISHRSLFTNEIELLQKTQESLLARLLDMQALYNSQHKKETIAKAQFSFVHIERKLVRFGKLNAKMIHKLENRFKSRKRKSAIKV